MHVLRLLSIKVIILLKKNKDSKPQISFTGTKFKQHRYIKCIIFLTQIMILKNYYWAEDETCASPNYYIAPKSSADIQSVALLHHFQSN